MKTVVSATPSIDVATLKDWEAQAASYTLIDVRTSAEFETVHIPGSYNVPLDTIDEHREALRRHLNQPVILVCRSGNRAGQAERKLAEVGMPNLTVLEGGLLAWEADGGEVRRGRRRWELERQVRLVAGVLVLTGVLGSVVFEPSKWLAGAVGAGLTIAALTNTCAMGMLLSKLPYNRPASCDVEAVVARLGAARVD